MNAEPWFAGTLTLGAVIVGAVIGILISAIPIPLAVAAAMSVGAGLEIWLHKQTSGG